MNSGIRRMGHSAPYLTIGEVAEKLGAQPWRVARLFERGLLPEPGRIGNSRAIHEDELPVIEQALRAAGYLRGNKKAPRPDGPPDPQPGA